MTSGSSSEHFELFEWSIGKSKEMQTGSSDLEIYHKVKQKTIKKNDKLPVVISLEFEFWALIFIVVQ